ncbi:MAG TPA: PAS domain S-box protein, partial [Methanosarcina sp.]|nr:PAS domain S-box protein [Methanosarcina sp.]
WDFIEEQDKAIAKMNVEKRRRGIDESLEFKFIRKDGSLLWALVNTKSSFDKDGKFAGSMSMITDITKRKEVEEALVRSEKEFRTLAENAPDMIARFDRQNHHMYVNPAVAEIYGLSQEEIIGKTHRELGIDPEKVKFWEEHHQNIFATKKPRTMEFQYISTQGKKYYFNTRTVPEFIDGEVVSVIDISRDITDIKEAEAALKETLSNLEELVKARTAELEKAYKSLKENQKSLAEAQKMAHIGNWDWNIITDKIYWSDEMCRIFGLDSQEFHPTYNVLLNHVHPDDQACLDNALKRALDGRKSDAVDCRIVLADGKERTVHSQVEVVFNEKQIPVHVRGTVQDITEKKEAEKAFLNAVTARKKEIHHRIKNNLQVISSLLDLQAEKFKNKAFVENSEVLETFRESQDRIVSIA